MTWQQAKKDFKNYLLIERGLSGNSVSNYSLDISKLINHLEANSIVVSPTKISVETLQQFIYEVAKVLNARSQSRIISGLKSFFNYMVFEGYRESNPMELIETPKIGQKLPDTLSISEIDELIDAIDTNKKEAERNKAILETLYGCGLRVSELINLRISDLYFKEGFIKVTGKGDKQRFVPIGDVTQDLITQYLENSRGDVPVKKNASDILFLNRRGNMLTRAMIFTIVKNLSKAANFQKNISP
ncbi:MAG: tyrosine-type recombinase/integrase, partial [Gillisia sp.]